MRYEILGIISVLVITSILLVYLWKAESQTYDCDDYHFTTCTNNWHNDFVNTYKFNPDDVEHFERWITPTQAEIGCGNWDITTCKMSKPLGSLFDGNVSLSWNTNGTILTVTGEK